MTAEILTLAMMARPGMAGEIHAIGIIDTIFLPQIPAGISCSILAKLRFRKAEEGVKQLQFSIIDDDGKPLATLPAQQINIQIAEGATSASATIVAQVNNLLMRRAGEYELGVTVDGRLELSVPIFVRLIVPQLPQQR